MVKIVLMLKRNILLGHDAASMLSRHMYRSVFIKISLETRGYDNFLGISLRTFYMFLPISRIV